MQFQRSSSVTVIGAASRIFGGFPGLRQPHRGLQETGLLISVNHRPEKQSDHLHCCSREEDLRKQL